MLALLLAGVVYLFLLLGASVFLVSILMPQTRPHALSAALWCVVWALVATAAAWLHQFLIERLTFALFRLYATAVTAGIGSVFGCCLGWWISANVTANFPWILWALSMLMLISGFGWAAYKGARNLRGPAPDTLTWISGDEYSGA